MRTTRVLLTLAVATLATACLDPAYEAGVGSVKGGTTDRTRTWVGRLTQNGWSCSASLIEPRIVITAKHCLDEGIAPSSVSFLASTGTRADTVVAKAIGLHYVGTPHAATGLPDEDVAVIALDRPVTVVATGPAPSTTVIDRLEGESIVLVGFGGKTDRGASGVRLSATGRIKDVFGGYGDAFQLDSARATATSGDSGGPVVLSSTGEIIGVVSGGTVMARVDTHQDLLEAARRDVAATPASTDPLDGRRGSARGRDGARSDERSGVDCACDTTDECDLDDEGALCACDAGCGSDAAPADGGACDCDATWSCDDGDDGGDCRCDPECTGDAAPAEAGDTGCACDVSWSCDAGAGGDCACDPECTGDAEPADDGNGDGDAACACDWTWDCDLDDDGWDCACDPEC